MRQSKPLWALSTSLLIGSLLLATESGCQSEPFCLNCQNGGGDGGGGNGDGGSGADLRDKDGGTGNPDQGPDLSGPCEPSNNGVEKCDGIDNDCNGTVDDVLPASLAADPNNCGACGNVCDFIGQKQFGECVVGAGGVPTCQPAGCLPGFVDVDTNVPGCEYACTPTTPATEVCDGVDNDCDGTIDNDFRDSAGNYTKSINNCGGCNIKCTLPGAVNKCDPGTDGLGHCAVDSCINDGTQTFRHNPASGDLNTTGCEYKCPVPSTTVTAAGEDCDSTTCDFPDELCDNIDQDCNFVADNDPTDLGQCASNCPGGLLANCVGQCTSGSYLCASGVRVCMGSTGPSTETCDSIDNNCNGIVDDPFVKVGTGTMAVPAVYSVDEAHCGSCATDCNLAHALNGCRETSTNSGIAECFVKSCDPGFAYPSRNGGVSSTTSGQCTGANGVLASGVMTGNQNGAGGLGCYYACAVKTREFCDGKDNDCDGCLDNDNPTAPVLDAKPDDATFCKQLGVCTGSVAQCTNRGTSTAAWKCNYASKTGICLDASGNPTAVETGCATAPSSRCDGLDNNCNGRIDEGLGLYQECTGSTGCSSGRTTCSGSGQSTCNAGFVCSGGFCTTACTAGQGVCAVTGPRACVNGSPGAALQCNAVAANNLAANELCDGKDNDCDGLVDEATNETTGNRCSGSNCQGYHEPMAQVQPRGCACTGNSQCPTGYTCSAFLGFGNRCVEGAGSVQACTADAQCTGGGSNRCTNMGSAVYVYRFEASRPNATAGSGGSDDPDPTRRRSCSATGVMPWTNVLQEDAADACALAKAANGSAMRLCREYEWQAACVGTTKSGDPQWSQTTTPTTFIDDAANSNGDPVNANACNVENSAGAVVATGSRNICGSVNTGSNIMDLSGNVIEWTSTSVTSGSNTYFRMRGGAFNSPRVGASCEYSFNLGQDDYLNSNVGFRCCSDTAP